MVNVRKLLVIWIVFFIISDSFASDIDSEAETDTKCKPYRAYIFWNTCSNDNTFLTQRNFISQLIDKMPNGSLVHFKLIGATPENTINIVKGNSNTEWQKPVSQIEPVKECIKQTIEFKHLNGAIEGTRGRHDAQEMASLIFFLFDKYSKIDKVNKAKRFLKDKLTYVVFTGRNRLPFALDGIATDKNHEYQLSTHQENNIVHLLEVVCRDSRLLCGTTNFWDSRTCDSCSFICSSDPSKYCRQECPYYKTGTLDNLRQYEPVFKEKTDNSSMQQDISMVVGVIVLIIFFICLCIHLCSFCVCFCLQKERKPLLINRRPLLT